MPHVQHTITVAAPPGTVYDVIADIGLWPVRFHPTVHVERLAGDAGSERVRIWAIAGEEVKTWTSRRELRPAEPAVTFRQEVSQPPVAGMSGVWRLGPRPDGGTDVVLEHDYRAVGDDPRSLVWIEEVTDRNSRSELAALKEVAEQAAAHRDALRVSFEDSVDVAGAAGDVYAFLHRAEDWPDRLPHVSRVALEEPAADLQILEMDTVTADGTAHTTKSVRVCFPRSRIVYKQTRVPALMAAHTGEWRLEEMAGGVRVTSAHTVVIRAEAVEDVLGEGATVDDARAFVRGALGANSRITLAHAKAFAEAK
ncbi:aromatase/cyclase [Streptomyces sp. NPDC001678]|uniref:aromatase/cyclase n=1 Tax=Streptomyces sp. NPDC001678 TaxID=3364599 RepID=UPI003689702C